MGQYYDGTKLLSLKDINGKKPEIYICTSNRTAGKTTYFNRFVVNRFLKYSEKFAILYRFNYELDECAQKFFKDIQTLFFPGYEMKGKKQANGIFTELKLNDECCGYAISLNSADQVKKYSHMFSDVFRILFDEFQSETNHYCDNEVRKLISIHTSIARGQGKQTRYVPVYMVGNPVTILNPYYIKMDIATRLRQDTKFLRGDGYVLEQGYNQSAAQAQKESGFNRAFKKDDYTAYAAQGIYLNDNSAFVEKPRGTGRYICTLKYQSACYGIRAFDDAGIIYCDNHPDVSHKNKIAVTTEDHEINYVMLRKNDLAISALRYYFEKGCFRFQDLKCKEAVLSALSY